MMDIKHTWQQLPAVCTRAGLAVLAAVETQLVLVVGGIALVQTMC